MTKERDAITGKEPEFTADEDCLMITMYRDVTTIAPVKAIVNETVYATVNVLTLLSALQNQILSLITEIPRISYEEFINQTGKVRTTIWRNLQFLVDLWILMR